MLSVLMGEPNEPPRSNGGRLLLVDDDEAVLRATKRVLVAAGYEVTACSSGDLALKLLETQSFDAMVSDIQMPGTTGLRLLRAVRGYDLDLPVVLITGQPDVETAADAVEYGALQYLIKPVDVEQMRGVVERAINVGRMARLKRSYVEEFGSGTFRIGDRAGVEATLDRALASLWMAYQPIVRAETGSIFAYEALLRSEEPLLPHPGAVLKAAEQASRIHHLGRVVRARIAADFARNGPADVILFVNLHPEDLVDPTLYEPSEPLAGSATRVVLEVTERASLENIRDVTGSVARLRTLGFRFALDDLGAGYAGLTSFTQLEPEFVKLDMSIVRDVHQSSTKQKVIRSMVQLCHDMGKEIVAEGVEKPEERDALLDLGCDLLQGYLFAKPGKPFPVVNATQDWPRTAT
jgi:EAL domain-containing protein (putative c-di-GMP-specific phosphodiesterase class I)/ActR/RegA family two-component response regulator